METFEWDELPGSVKVELTLPEGRLSHHRYVRVNIFEWEGLPRSVKVEMGSPCEGLPHHPTRGNFCKIDSQTHRREMG